MSIKALTQTPQQGQQLVKLGIVSHSFFFHSLEDVASNTGGKEWYTGIFINATISDTMVPAWTKAELDVMIGPDFPKPELEVREKARKETEYNFPVHYNLPGQRAKMILFDTGAKASADVLITLLENELLTAKEAIDRYNNVFVKG